MARPSRRGFLQSAAAAPLAAQPPQKKPGQRRTHFAPQGRPQKLSDNLFVFEDACKVYVVREGARAVLIDFGSGKILDHLRDMGIDQVDWILHTHHHREQCQGDRRAVERGIPIAVPAHERHLFADAENFWRNRRVFHLYYVHNDFNTITQNIPVARGLADYGTFRWGSMDFFILPTPGHTLGAVTLLATIDGKRTAFTGGLIHSPGKIQNLYDTQINYGGAEGIDLGIFSLIRLGEQKPELLCPSEGEVMREPEAAIRQTVAKLTEYYSFQTNGGPSYDSSGFAVSPHLVAHDQTTSSFYAILSDSGKALFIDYGSANGRLFNAFERATAVPDRIRFVEHNINELKRNFGMKKIDVVMPTHMHDDHVNGIPHLIRNYGAEVWCLDNMVDILQNPRGHNLGCTLGEAFKVTRTLRPGERFRWEEFEFEITHSPGHTEYQMALFAAIDGRRVAFTGDAFFAGGKPEGTMRHNLIFRNHVENDSHVKSIRNLMAHAPELIAPGHGKPYPVDRAMMEATERKMLEQQRLFHEVLPEGMVDFGLDPGWVHIYPYQMLAAPGERQSGEVRVRNYKSTVMKVEVALAVPDRWTVEPEALAFEIPARGQASRPFHLTIPRGWRASSPRVAIAADVMSDGRYLGQIAEAVVDIRAARDGDGRRADGRY